MRTSWICNDDVKVVLRLLTPANRLAVEMSLRYGMRIGDVLETKRSDVVNGSWTYKEQKTGKSRRIRCQGDFQRRLLAQSGRLYVFEHRTNWKKHRTRQAVYKDIKRAATALRLDGNVGTHSARKNYAVNQLRVSGDLKKVQRLLNHSDEAVTMLYAFADELSSKEKKGKKDKKQKKQL